MERNGNKVNAGADSSSPQFLNEHAPVNLDFVQVESKDVEMPCVTVSRAVGRQLHFFQSGKSAIVYLRVVCTDLDKVVQLSELVDSDGGLNITEVVLKPVRHYLVVPVSMFCVPVPTVMAGTVQR